MKRSLFFAVLLTVCLCSAAQFRHPATQAVLRTTAAPQPQEPVYKLKLPVDLPLTAAAAGFSIYGFSQIYSKDASTVEAIQNLNPENINGFDRWAAGKNSEKAANASDLFFYGSIPAPLLLLLDKNVRGDALKTGVMYLQAMSLTGVLYTGVPMLADRYRPLTYNAQVQAQDPESLTSGNERNSFFAGHVALVGTATFFAAKVYHDHHPDSKLRYALWGGAALATGATGYLRHRAGKHFPSDILVGTAVGALSGILVPQFHKSKLGRRENLTLLPFSGRSHGLAAVYRFN